MLGSQASQDMYYHIGYHGVHQWLMLGNQGGTMKAISCLAPRKSYCPGRHHSIIRCVAGESV